MSSERKEEKPSQAVAVCGESRPHGENGGEGKTQFGWASRPYPLKGCAPLLLSSASGPIASCEAAAEAEPVTSDG
jgi:hypothetical protein